VDEWKRAVHRYELLAEERVVPANNVGAFCKFKRTTNHFGIRIFTDKNGLPILNGQVKVNAFNAYFSFFRFSRYCSVLKPESLECECGQKLWQNLTTF